MLGISLEFKTAFNTTTGHYQLRYGLSRAPSVFQCFINDVLQECLGQYVTAYIDDILIYSPNLHTHVSQLSRVLQLMRENQLYVKGEKCCSDVARKKCKCRRNIWVPAVDNWSQRSEQIWEQAHQHILASTERHHHQADKRRAETPMFKPGDRV